MAGSENICLIIPCYNEADRIDFEAIRQGAAGLFRLVFVNDGSTDGTGALLAQNCADNWSVLDLEQNVGKAEAVRQGIVYLQQQDYFAEVDWVGFWDADLATPMCEAHNFIVYSRSFFQDADVVVGSRINRLGANINRAQIRHYLGRLFITVIDTIFRLGCYDTQCGAKLFRRDIIASVFDVPFISRWIFDVELLLRLKKGTGAQIIEYPLIHWEDVQGSKLVLRRTVFKVIWDIVRIYRRYGRC